MSQSQEAEERQRRVAGKEVEGQKCDVRSHSRAPRLFSTVPYTLILKEVCCLGSVVSPIRQESVLWEG